MWSYSNPAHQQLTNGSGQERCINRGLHALEHRLDAEHEKRFLRARDEHVSLLQQHTSSSMQPLFDQIEKRLVEVRQVRSSVSCTMTMFEVGAGRWSRSVRYSLESTHCRVVYMMSAQGG